MIKADSLKVAIELAKGCPILTIGGNVEVRESGLIEHTNLKRKPLYFYKGILL